MASLERPQHSSGQATVCIYATTIQHHFRTTRLRFVFRTRASYTAHRSGARTSSEYWSIHVMQHVETMAPLPLHVVVLSVGYIACRV